MSISRRRDDTPREEAQRAPGTASAAEFATEDGDRAVVFRFALLTDALPSSLSPAEREIVAAVIEGMSNAAIASRRGVSPRTIANQVATVFRKLQVGSRAELIARVAGQR